MTLSDFLIRLISANQQESGFVVHELANPIPPGEVKIWQDWAHENGFPEGHLSLLLAHNGINIARTPESPGAVRIRQLEQIQTAADYLGDVAEDVKLPSDHCFVVADAEDSVFVILLCADSGKYCLLDEGDDRPGRTFKGMEQTLDWLAKKYVAAIKKTKSIVSVSPLDIPELSLLGDWSKDDVSISDLAISPDGASVLAALDSEAILRLSVPALDHLPRPGAPDGNGGRVHWKNDGQTVVMSYSGAKENRIVEVSLATGTFRTFEDTPGFLYGMELSPQDRWLAASCFDDAIHFIDVATGKIAGKADGMASYGKCLKFMSDDRLLAGTRTGTLAVVSVPDGTVLQSHAWSKKSLDCLAVDSTGELVCAVAGDSKIAKIARLTTGKVVRQLRGHTRFIMCCAFSPDGRYVATGGGDGNVFLWSAATGKPIATSGLHKSAETDPRYSIIEAVRFSPSGDVLISCGSDGFIRSFKIPTAT